MTRTPIQVAAALWDERDETGAHRDMLPIEQAFLTAVDQIRWRKVDAYRSAQRVWGDIPRIYRMCLLTADKTCADDLANALAAYDAAAAAMEDA